MLFHCNKDQINPPSAALFRVTWHTCHTSLHTQFIVCPNAWITLWKCRHCLSCISLYLLTMRHSYHTGKVVGLKIPILMMVFLLLLRIREKSRHLITSEQLGMASDCCCCCCWSEQSGLCFAATDRNLNDGLLWANRAIFRGKWIVWGSRKSDGFKFVYCTSGLIFFFLHISWPPLNPSVAHHIVEIRFCVQSEQENLQTFMSIILKLTNIGIY